MNEQNTAKELLTALHLAHADFADQKQWYETRHDRDDSTEEYLHVVTHDYNEAKRHLERLEKRILLLMRLGMRKEYELKNSKVVYDETNQ